MPTITKSGDIRVKLPKSKAIDLRREQRLLASVSGEEWIRLRVALRVYTPGNRRYIEPNGTGINVKCRSIKAAMLVKQAVVEALARLDGVRVEE